MQYLIVAYDGTDDTALERRMAVREVHLELARQNYSKGVLLYGAGILDDDGKMIGSMLLCEFLSRRELDEWLKVEPYVTGNVWQKIEVHRAQVPLFCMQG
jgi:uncharacterized protein YciI